MSDWRPIHTAPLETDVMLGRWQMAGEELVWIRDTGKARIRILVFFQMRTYRGEAFSHWKPLPPPPVDTQGEDK